ncbi:MAG: DnaJ domain-containing protein [Xanthobacteraceae bacterium]|nr:DnaJ domain-containing protein [Xanthobacteraceae bacterium]MBX3522730.1 DnaJ domain-containing protein [Xanthobacteraceae bacterium]MBX3534321.1 DnaJ domain-containing protein [Xanthobacteraceae bacterium]MBX3550126.1 DnaJ domain-containing protein [Xanthobacteraceae bacterium]MCW5677472.1 DnaJ domain-containing protein [Xanthobacteraceae bacterium]
MGIPTLLLGLAVLFVLIFVGRMVSSSDPKKLAKLVRTIGGIGSFALAVLLATRGQIFLAVPVAFFGAGLLGWISRPAGWSARTQRKTGQVSRVRSQFVEMELDHDSGEMRGRVLKGKYENVPLDALDPETLTALRSGFDEESRALLEAYLDRRAPGWRENVEEDAGPGSGQATRHGPMTEEEAHQILGLEAGATDAEIRRAHRSLMKKLHPDQGGSTYLAARVNEAKEILLRRHH